MSWPSHEAEVVQRSAHDARDVLHLRPLDAGRRIKIDAELIRMIEILRANRMGMELETRKVRHPRERRRAAWHDFCAVRPDGNFNSTTSIQSGRDSGARF